MICVIAGNHLEAQTWATGQNLEDDEWFYPRDANDLLHRSNFHTVVVGTAGMNVPESYFNRVYDLALTRGRINRS